MLFPGCNPVYIFSGMEDDVRMSLQDQLVDCIMCVLCANPHLHYYQGFHDIVVTFLLVVGDDVTVTLLDVLSNKHLRYINIDVIV